MTSREPAFTFATPADSPGLLLWRTTTAWQRAIRDALADVDLTHTQFVFLAIVAWHQTSGTRPTQREVADMAGADANTTSATVNRMAERGLVEKTRSADDGRAWAVGLTTAGKKLAAQALPLVEEADRRFFGDKDTTDALQRLARVSSEL